MSDLDLLTLFADGLIVVVVCLLISLVFDQLVGAVMKAWRR